MRKSRPLCATFLASLALVACHPHEDEQGDDFALSTGAAPVARVDEFAIHVPPPPFSEGIFPCSDCHSEDVMPANPKRRELKIAHQDMAKMVGASREMVSRVMKDLEDRGFIETRADGSMLVKDRLTTLG